jgi:hypothetical protein
MDLDWAGTFLLLGKRSDLIRANKQEIAAGRRKARYELSSFVALLFEAIISRSLSIVYS